jgi:hypothetical protein
MPISQPTQSRLLSFWLHLSKSRNPRPTLAELSAALARPNVHPDWVQALSLDTAETDLPALAQEMVEKLAQFAKTQAQAQAEQAVTSSDEATGDTAPAEKPASGENLCTSLTPPQSHIESTEGFAHETDTPPVLGLGATMMHDEPTLTDVMQ